MLNYQSYKGRSIDFSKKAMVYRNLHNGMFSVKQNGLVVAHVESIVFDVAVFKVIQSGRDRVLIEKKKNVHAFVVGYVKSVNEPMDVSEMKAVSYNPYKHSYFYYKEDESQVSVLGYNDVYCSVDKGLFVS